MYLMRVWDVNSSTLTITREFLSLMLKSHSLYVHSFPNGPSLSFCLYLYPLYIMNCHMAPPAHPLLSLLSQALLVHIKICFNPRLFWTLGLCTSPSILSSAEPHMLPCWLNTVKNLLLYTSTGACCLDGILLAHWPVLQKYLIMIGWHSQTDWISCNM